MAELVRPVHEFRLYRSGWVGEELPWPDNQLWAAGNHDLFPEGEQMVTLAPRFGHAASWYRVQLWPQESPEVGWSAYQALLEIDACMVGTGRVPLSWYTARPSDWPSGIARFPETYGPRRANIKFTFDPMPDPRGVWTLAVRRFA